MFGIDESSSPKRARVTRKLPMPRDSSFSLSRSSSSFSLSSNDSELESLPDFTDDDGTPQTSPIRPKRFPSPAFHTAKPSVFDVPEIVHRIVQFVDAQNTVIPQENTPIRRRPLSLKHALLTYGDEKAAREAFEEKNRSELERTRRPRQSRPLGLRMRTLSGRGEKKEETRTFSSSSISSFSLSQSPFNFTYSPLHACLLVNKLFHAVTVEILNRKIMFSSEKALQDFARNKSLHKPEVVVFHKLFTTKQSVLMESFQQATQMGNTSFEHVSWLELYMCPKMYPPVELISRSLRKLVITGSKVIDDRFLLAVAQRCPNLEILDLRACEFVTDSGVYHIAKHCRKLTTINLGRKAKGNLITDHSLSHLVQNNRRLVTVGLAGCHISDKTIWDLAIHCSGTLERLSLNACPLITNYSVPLILSRRNHQFFRHLSVLELRFNEQITDLVPIIEFKRRQEYRGLTMLVEVCETLAKRIWDQEQEMDRRISQRMFSDILEWVNGEDGDGDWRVLERASSMQL